MSPRKQKKNTLNKKTKKLHFIFAITIIFAAIGYGMFSGLIPNVFASAASSIIKTSSTDFSQGIFSGPGVGVAGSGDDGKLKLSVDDYQSSVNNTAGLATYYKMDGNHIDSKGGKNAIAGSGWSNAGKINNGISFDNSDDYVQVDNFDSAAIANTGSVDLWVKLRDMGNNTVIIANGDMMQNTGSFDLGFWDGYLRFDLLGANQIDYATANIHIDNLNIIGNWTHIGATWDGSVVKLYVNGINVSTSGNYNFARGANELPLTLGRDALGRGYLNGYLDEVKIYNKALSEAEIVESYNLGNGTETASTGLVGGWHLNEASGVIADDFSIGNANGTLNNFSAAFAQPKYGSAAASFDGSNVVDLPSDVGVYGQGTLEMWVKFDSGHEYDMQYLWVSADSFGAAYENRLYTYAGTLNFAAYNIDAGGYTVSFNDMPLPSSDAWHHVALAIGTNDARFYIDGALVASDNTVDLPIFSPGHNHLGGYVLDGRDIRFRGSMDEVAFYSSALDESTIQGHYNAPAIIEYSGSWESPINENVINLNWNGGWGDGTADSVAFSTDVANLGGSENAQIAFYMKTAPTIEDLQSELSPYEYKLIGIAIDGITFSKTKIELDDLGIGTGNNRFVQVKAVLQHDIGSITTPELNSFSINYLADSTAPINGANIGMKIYPDSEDLFQAAADGIHWTSYFQNGGNGYYPKFIWDSGSDGGESGIKGYCLYLGKDPLGDPAGDASYDATDANYSNYLNESSSPVSLSGAENKCHFIASVNEVNGKNIFQSVDNGGAYYRTQLYSSYDTLYFNIKAIDNENNLSDDMASYKFAYEDVDPKDPSYVSLPDHYVSNKAVTMSWPIPVTGDLTGEQNKDAASDCHILSQDEDGNNRICDTMSGLLGYQYRINNGKWYGLLRNGKEDVSDVIPIDQGYFTFDADEVDLHDGINTVYLRVLDNAGNTKTSHPSALLRIDTTSPSEPINVIASPFESTTNSYAFSWSPPVARIGDVSKLDFCYTINTVPSEFSCTFTGQNICIDQGRGNYSCSLAADAFATRPGTNTFYVVAKSETGVINYDNYATVEFSYNGTAPGMPRGMDVSDISIRTTSNWKLALSWEEPEDKGAGVASYKVFRSDKEAACSSAPGQFSEVGLTGGTSYVDTGLSQKTYYYCVKSCDSGNSCSAYSQTVAELPTGKFTTPAELISELDVSNITTKKAVINWSTGRNSDSKISIGEKSDEYYKEETSNSDQTTDHSIELNNLSPNTVYYFRAKWTDEDGNTGTSAEKSFETEPAPSVKDAKAEDIGISSASINLTTKAASKVKIYYGKSESFGGSTTLATSTKESSYTIKLDNLSDETKYYYKVNTFDSEGNEYEGTTLDFTTLPRPRISDVQVEQIKDSAQPGVHIIWNSNTEISSIVSYGPVNDPADKKNDVQVDLISGQHEATIMDLRPTLTYALVVRGIDKAGNEAISEQYTFTTASDTRPPVISNITVEGVNIGSGADKKSQLAVSWDTDEAATSQVEFGEGVSANYAQKTQQDSNLTNNHMVVISGLQPSKVYHLRIISHDSADNISNSIDTVSITPKAIDSAYELVVGNLMDVFKFLRVAQN